MTEVFEFNKEKIEIPKIVQEWVMPIYEEGIVGLAYINGKIWSASIDCYVSCWDKNGKRLGDPIRYRYTCMVVINGDLYCGRPNGDIDVRDANFEYIYSLTGHTERVCNIILAGGYLWTSGKDGTIRRWESVKYGGWTCTHVLSDHSASITSMVSGGGFIWSGDENGIIKQWSYDAKCKRSFDNLIEDASVSSLLFVNSGNNGNGMLWNGNSDGSLHQWDPITGALIQAYEANDNNFIIALVSVGNEVWSSECCGDIVEYDSFIERFTSEGEHIDTLQNDKSMGVRGFSVIEDVVFGYTDDGDIIKWRLHAAVHLKDTFKLLSVTQQKQIEWVILLLRRYVPNDVALHIVSFF